MENATKNIYSLSSRQARVIGLLIDLRRAFLDLRPVEDDYAGDSTGYEIDQKRFSDRYAELYGLEEELVEEMNFALHLNKTK